MRFLLFTLVAASVLLLTACTFRTSTTSEAPSSPVPPAPIPDSPPAAAQVIEQDEVAGIGTPPAPEFALDPAPAPPSESSTSPPKESPPEATSSEDVFDSVARVFRGVVEGTADKTGAGSQGSVFDSITRALRTGFEEAAVGEDAADE